MAVVEEVLATRLELLGVGGYLAGFQQISGALGRYGDELDDISSRQLSFGLAAGAVGAAGLAFFGKAAIAAGEDVATFGRASANLKGQLSAEELADFTGELERATGVADDTIAGFLGLLGTFQATGDQAKRLAEPILNASEALKAQGVSVESLSVAVGKALQTGKASGLIRTGIVLDEVAFKTADLEGRTRLLTDALNAQGGATAARDALKTLPGALRAVATAGGSVVEALGEPLIGTLQAGANAATELAHGFTDLPGPIKTAVTLIGVGLAGAMVVYSAQTLIAIGLTARLAAAQLKAADAATRMATANSAAGAAAVKGGVMRGFNPRVAAGVGVADLALQFLPDDFAGGAGRGLKNIGNAAALGAAAGSFIPGLGTAAGAAIGGGVGAVGNLFGGAEKSEAEKQTELLGKIADNTDPSKLPLSTSDIPGARQIGAMTFARALS
jgi:hypothetical protein